MKDNILVSFSNDRDLADFNYKFYKELSQRYNIYTVKSNKNAVRLNSLVADNHLIDRDECEKLVLSEDDKVATRELIIQIEKKLNISLVNVISSDRHLGYEYFNDEIDYFNNQLSEDRKDDKKFEEIVLKYVYFVNKKLQEIQPQFMIMRAANFFSTLLIAVSNYYGIKTFGLLYSRALGGKELRMYACKNYCSHNFLLKDEFKKQMEIETAPSKRADALIEEFLSKPSNPLPLTVQGNYWKTIRNVLAIAKNILNGRIDTKSYQFSFFSSVAWNAIKHITKFPFQVKAYCKNSIKDVDQKFSYFALGQQPELVLLEMAPEFIDQMNSIKQFSRYLPFGINLMIREHPYNIGRRPFLFHRKINSLGNVTLGSTKEPAFDYIRKAESVLTINGTTGWEAILYKKPTFKLEHSFYDLLDFAYDLRSYKDLESKYTEHVEYINNYDDEEYYLKIKRFIDAEYNTTFTIDDVSKLVDIIITDSTVDREQYNYWNSIF